LLFLLGLPRPRRPAVAALVALVAELPRRLVPQPAVRPHPVVLAAEPRRLRPRVRHRLELARLQELVAQPAVERLDVALLPRAPGRHRRQLAAPAGQPAAQRPPHELPPLLPP